MLNDLVVREHDWLIRSETTSQGKKNISQLQTESFDALQALLEDPGSDLSSVATFGRFQGQDAIKLSQWVGIIRLSTGQAIEILPKTHERPGSRAYPGSDLRSRSVLLRLLAATDERFRIAPPATLDTAHMTLYEVVLRYALDGIRSGMRRGLPHAYVPVREERSSLRGQLDLTRQMRQLPTRNHQLHVTYDEYLPDRPETRLTRLAVERIKSATRIPSTRLLAGQLLALLDGVPPSRNIAQDFLAWRLDRGQQHYAPLAPLCRMVLYQLNPLVSGKNAESHALLFDMNVVYESYVAERLKRARPDWKVETQVTGKSLGRVRGQQAFEVQIDLLITLPNDELIIADTKWKRLDPQGAPTYGVAPADAYQMLAYSEIYQRQQSHKFIWLIYPSIAGIATNLPPIHFAGGQTLRLLTIDLEREMECDLGWPSLPESTTSDSIDGAGLDLQHSLNRL